MDGFWSMFCLFVVVVSLHKALSVAAARADAAKLNMLGWILPFPDGFSEARAGWNAFQLEVLQMLSGH
ncbi:hypothetical protein [Escherichia coli]|uniref:hypothetical protein n=1 Tax=Escherichia coli TaxID=562 RepID=UPI0035A5C349